jgi:hypothetical protein
MHNKSVKQTGHTNMCFLTKRQDSHQTKAIHNGLIFRSVNIPREIGL